MKWTGIGVGALLVAVVGFGMLFGKKDSTSTANSGGSQAEVSDSLDAAPYTQEMNRKIDRVGKSIETPALQGESSTVQLQRMVEYFNKGYAKAGYSFDKSLVRYVEYMKKTNNVPDLRPEAQPMYQAFAFVAGMASSGADLNVALPGPTLAPVREYFAPKTASVESKPIPAVEVAQPATATTQTPQAENKAEPDPVEKDGICKGLNLMQTNHQIECHERRYAVADQELNANYKDVVTKLDPAQKTKLRDLQRAWIKERDSTCAKELEGGGTMAMVNASGCKFQMTEARAAFLKTYKP